MKRKRVLLWRVEIVCYWRNIDKAQFLPGLYADGEFFIALQSLETGFVPMIIVCLIWCPIKNAVAADDLHSY